MINTEAIFYEGATNMENILEVKNLSKSYPNSSFGLNNVSFSLPPGSIMGFISCLEKYLPKVRRITKTPSSPANMLGKEGVSI